MRLSQCGRPHFSELSHSLFHQKLSKEIKPKNPYVTPEIETAIKAKRSALRKMKKDNTAEAQDKFKQLRNRVTHLLRKSERPHATKLFRQTRLQPSETASKFFWQHIKEVQGKSKQTLIPKLISNDNTATTDLEKAEVLNGFFSSKTIDHLHNYGPGTRFGALLARIGCDVCVSHLSFRFSSTLECRSVISVVFLAVPIEAWLVLPSYLIVFNGQVSSGSAFLLAIRQADW